MLGDLLDRDALQTAMKGCDAVVHLAAAADVDDVALRPAEAEAVNARGTLNVLEAARRAGVARVVYASTIWVYGSATRHRRRGPHRRAARPPLHRDQARRRDVLPLLRRALRPGLHRPALRDPVRPARAARGRDPDLRAQGAGRRAADDRRRGAAVAALRLRRGPRRGRRPRPGARRPAGASTTSSATRASPSAGSPTRSATSSAASRSSTPGPAPRTSRAPRSRAPAPPPSSAGARPTSFAEGLRRYVDWHVATSRRPRRVAAPPPQASRLRRRPRLTPRLASLVLSWLTVVAVAGGLVSYLASIRAVGLTAASDRTIAVLSISTLAGYLAMALDGPRRALWTFTGWALAAAGLAIVYMGEFREALNLAGPDESRVLLGLAGARWPSPSPTRACACGARARSAWRPTGRRPGASERHGLQPRSPYRLEHGRQRLRRPPPRSRGAVGVGVVEQDDVARAQVAAGAPGDRLGRRVRAPVAPPARPQQRRASRDGGRAPGRRG